MIDVDRQRQVYLAWRGLREECGQGVERLIEVLYIALPQHERLPTEAGSSCKEQTFAVAGRNDRVWSSSAGETVDSPRQLTFVHRSKAVGQQSAPIRLISKIWA